MIQAYSSNISINAGSYFPFNNVVISKGCAEKLFAPTGIQLNQRGVYLVEFDGFGTGSDTADVSMQLYANGVALPEAITTVTTATGDVVSFGFKTFVQVIENNTKCCCYNTPTILQLACSGTNLTEVHGNIVITKIK